MFFTNKNKEEKNILINITKSHKKLIFCAASILIFNATAVPAVASLLHNSVESSSNNTKISSLYFSKIENNNSQIAKAENKGACKVNPKVCT